MSSVLHAAPSLPVSSVRLGSAFTVEETKAKRGPRLPGSQRQVCDPSLDCSPRPDNALPESTQAVLTDEGDRGPSRGGSLGSRANAWDANTKVRSRRKCARGRCPPETLQGGVLTPLSKMAPPVDVSPPPSPGPPWN